MTASTLIARAELPAGQRAVCAAFHPLGGELAVGVNGARPHIALMDGALEVKKRLYVAEDGREDELLWLMYSPSGALLAAFTRGRVQLWEGESVTSVPASVPVGESRRAAFTPDGRWLVYRRLNSDIVQWDTVTGEHGGKSDRIQLPLELGEKRPEDGRAVSPDGTRAALIDGDAVRLVALPGEHALWEAPAPEGGVVAMAFAPDGGALCVCGAAELSLWRVERESAARAELDKIGYGLSQLAACASDLPITEAQALLSTRLVNAGIGEVEADRLRAWLIEKRREDREQLAYALQAESAFFKNQRPGTGYDFGKDRQNRKLILRFFALVLGSLVALPAGLALMIWGFSMAAGQRLLPALGACLAASVALTAGILMVKAWWGRVKRN